MPPIPSVVGVLPTYNEERNVARAVATMRSVPEISDVVVVDGASSDRTVRRAQVAGARVIPQKVLQYPGKGWAIETALEETREDVLVFFDADVHNIEPEMVRRLIEPILAGRADHALARFERKGGRVTALTAKPLLAIYFPEVRFEQPLTGEFASHRDVLSSIALEKDWGLESGLVIDLVMKGFRVEEVDIGFKDHEMKDLEDLRIMGDQVARAILKKAIEYGRYRRRAVTGEIPPEQTALPA